MAEEMGQLDDETAVGDSFNLLGIIAMEEGRFDDSRALLDEGRAIRERLGDEPRLQRSLHNQGLLAMTQGDYGRATVELESSLAMAEKHGLEPSVANSLCDLGFAELGAGRLDRSRGLRFGEALEAAGRLGWKENVAYCSRGRWGYRSWRPSVRLSRALPRPGGAPH